MDDSPIRLAFDINSIGSDGIAKMLAEMARVYHEIGGDGLVFRFRIDPGGASVDAIRRVFRAINGIHEASGGDGFVFVGPDADGWMTAVPAVGGGGG